MSTLVKAIAQNLERLFLTNMHEFFKDIDNFFEVSLCQNVLFHVSSILTRHFDISLIKILDEISAGRSDLIITFVPIKS